MRTLYAGTELLEQATEIAMYLKYDHARDGSLKEGDPAPDVPLVTLSGDTVPLSSFMNTGRPLVILAGSYS